MGHARERDGILGTPGDPAAGEIGRRRERRPLTHEYPQPEALLACVGELLDVAEPDARGEGGLLNAHGIGGGGARTGGELEDALQDRA